MKKAILATILLSAGVLLTSVVQAEDKVADSDASVKVTAGSGPVDPEDPNNPGGETGQNGPLSLDQVIQFEFADLKLSGGSTSVPLKATTMQNAQVTDARGTGAGWQLQVKQSELQTSDQTKTLKGAQINLANAVVAAGRTNTSTDAPTMNTASLALNENYQPLTTAAAQTGLGTWLIKYNADSTNDITLKVPAGNLIGDYTGTVTWQLSDSPTPTNP